MQTHVAEGLTAVSNQLIVSEKFYYVNENTDLGLDESVVFGSWSGPIVRYTNQDGYFSDTFTITFAESDDPFTGNVQITEVYGDEVTIPTYAFFDGKTGILSIAPDQPYTNFTTGYDVGILNADSPTKPLEFRYTNEGQLYLQNCEFVEFLLYEEGTTTQTNYWWGYFYGNTSDYHVLLTKDDANPSPAAVARPAQTKAPARVSGTLARISSRNL